MHSMLVNTVRQVSQSGLWQLLRVQLLTQVANQFVSCRTTSCSAFRDRSTILLRHLVGGADELVNYSSQSACFLQG